MLFDIFLFVASAVAQNAPNASLVTVPDSLTYYIPASNFTSNLAYEWTNGTTTTNNTLNSLLRTAASSTFISYTPEFAALIGSEPPIYSIPCPAGRGSCAFEAGVWIPSTNEVWLTPSSYIFRNPEEGVTAFNLDTNDTYVINGTTPFYGNGGYLFGDKVWFAGGAQNDPASIFSVDVAPPHKVTPLINSYFGIPFPAVDEPVWVTRADNKSYLFFTGVSFAVFLNSLGDDIPIGDLPNAIWRFDPQSHSLQPVIDRTSLNTPNGIRVTPDQKTMYVTTSNAISAAGGGEGKGNVSDAIPGIYKFDLTEDCYPVNGRLWGLARTGIPDGIHVDDAGRVWTGEGGGIVVRSPAGKVLGEINTVQLKRPSDESVANFALAGDKLVIGAFDHALVIQLAQTVVARNSSIVN